MFANLQYHTIPVFISDVFHCWLITTQMSNILLNARIGGHIHNKQSNTVRWFPRDFAIFQQISVTVKPMTDGR